MVTDAACVLSLVKPPEGMPGRLLSADGLNSDLHLLLVYGTGPSGTGMPAYSQALLGMWIYNQG